MGEVYVWVHAFFTQTDNISSNCFVTGCTDIACIAYSSKPYIRKPTGETFTRWQLMCSFLCPDTTERSLTDWPPTASPESCWASPSVVLPYSPSSSNNLILNLTSGKLFVLVSVEQEEMERNTIVSWEVSDVTILVSVGPLSVALV